MNPDKFLDYLAWTLLVAAMFLLKLSGRLLDNIIKAKSFLLEYSLLGAVLGAAALFLIYRTNPFYYKGGEKRAGAVLSFFFGILALTVFGAAYYNLETSKSNRKNLKAFVSDKSKNIRYGTNYLTLEFDNRTERFTPLRTEWEKISENDTILLTVGKGRLGYDHILTFSDI